MFTKYIRQCLDIATAQKRIHQRKIGNKEEVIAIIEKLLVSKGYDYDKLHTRINHRCANFVTFIFSICNEIKDDDVALETVLNYLE